MPSFFSSFIKQAKSRPSLSDPVQHPISHKSLKYSGKPFSTRPRAQQRSSTTPTEIIDLYHYRNSMASSEGSLSPTSSVYSDDLETKPMSDMPDMPEIPEASAMSDIEEDLEIEEIVEETPAAHTKEMEELEEMQSNLKASLPSPPDSVVAPSPVTPITQPVIAPKTVQHAEIDRADMIRALARQYAASSSAATQLRQASPAREPVMKTTTIINPAIAALISTDSSLYKPPVPQPSSMRIPPNKQFEGHWLKQGTLRPEPKMQRRR